METSGADFIMVLEIFSCNDAADMDESDSTQKALTSRADQTCAVYPGHEGVFFRRGG